jgi:hypothetical protein
MADYRAIWAVAEAVIVELQSRCCPPDIGSDLGFQVYGSHDFSNRPIDRGASLFVHRIMLSGAHRTPAGRVLAGGQRLRNRLPIEVHFLLTLWGEASMQLTLAGWIMRVLEDNPLLSPATLNASGNPVYGADEVVEIMPADLSNEDLLRLWDTLGNGVVYQLSLPYVARVIQIDSTDSLPTDGGGAVQRRRLDAGELLP